MVGQQRTDILKQGSNVSLQLRWQMNKNGTRFFCLFVFLKKKNNNKDMKAFISTTENSLHLAADSVMHLNPSDFSYSKSDIRTLFDSSTAPLGGPRHGCPTLSLKGGDPVSDIVLHTLPGAGTQCLWLGLQTLHTVVFLRDSVPLDKMHHMPFYSIHLCFPPFMFTFCFGTCSVKIQHLWVVGKKKSNTI